MSTRVIDFITNQAASFIWYKFHKHATYGAAADALAVLRSGQQEVLDDLKVLHRETLLWDAIQKIEFWAEEMERLLRQEQELQWEQDQRAPWGDRTTISDSSKCSPRLDKLYATLGDNAVGVRFQMYTLYSGLVGRHGLLGRNGLIGIVCKRAYSRLADESNSSYTITSYLAEVDGWLERIARVLRDGLVLLSTQVDLAEAENSAQQLGSDLKAAEALAHSLFPCALRLLKPSYTSPIERFWWKLESVSSYQSGSALETVLTWSDGKIRFRQAPRSTSSMNSNWALMIHGHERDTHAAEGPRGDGSLIIFSRINGDCVGYRSPLRGIFDIKTVRPTGVCVDRWTKDFAPLSWKLIPLIEAGSENIPLVRFTCPTLQGEAGGSRWQPLINPLREKLVLKNDGIKQTGGLCDLEREEKTNGLSLGRILVAAAAASVFL